MTPQETIKQAIMADPANQAFTAAGIEPLFAAPETAKILIIGQAPGLKTQAAGLYFKDRSGDRLRDWLGIDEATFYDSGLISVLAMDFYFPGAGKSGDLPPRPDFAPKWHPKLIALMPQIELIILIGTYAQHYYLKQKKSATVTETVRDYQTYLPHYFPLIHPSPRNQIWMAKNPWFEEDVLPHLKSLVATLLKSTES
ncbi:uracil-DNA glycosylase family protein [Streptococcus moroccensis]|uniref:Uracil-DNA glycosylase n=1 Tax=Streptococcus moroccensis TaxID=1451356 RepID=A0ABT9YTJ1_9STRE|nr:uracil-DNA glycosylase family protein [Streptococcus moroccensis]MDQ0222678.1 uracil-DNA glycosylase [Streptococcus moroccensis]